MKMTKAELLSFLDAAIKDSVREDSTYIQENADALDAYNGELYGDEIEGQSQVVANDCMDLVEADMPSLARVFLSSQDIMEFKPNSSDPADIKEAEEKTKYVNYLVRSQRDSFKTLIDWLKAAEIQRLGIVTFYVDEQTKTEEREFSGMPEDELVLLLTSMQSAPGVQAVDIVAQSVDDQGYYSITARIKRKIKRFTIAGVPIENFHLTKNATSLQDAMLAGHDSLQTRGSLIAQGFDRETVKGLTRMVRSDSGKLIADKRLPGAVTDDATAPHWASETVLVETLFPLVDFDGDGIPERRRIVKSGQTILENKAFDRAPYAIMSTILMPHTAIGKSRTEIVMPTQYVKTHLTRSILDNIYRVVRPRWLVNDSDQGGVELDDMLTHRLDGIVRVNGTAQFAAMPMETPYVGDKALMVMQYVDAARAQTTGSLMASQGLEVDALHKETATRFQGVADQSQAKIELVARCLAETGFRDLFEGMAWLVSRYQDEATEIMVLKKPIKIDPRKWIYDHYCESLVGLGAGDTQEMLANMSGLFQTQQQLLAQGSPIVDQKKLYNTGAKLVKLMGIHNVTDYLNDPEQPPEVLLAEVEKLGKALQIMQAQMQEMQALANSDTIKAQTQIAVENNRAEIAMGQIHAREETDLRKFLLDQAQKQENFNRDMLARLTEMDLKYNGNAVDDIPGTLENNANNL
jgi:hypothetical protein